MVSLIATVRNEADSIVPWIESLLLQTKQPDEIVIVDGMSTDNTYEQLQQVVAGEPRLRVFQKEGNISVGRNAAIEAAAGDVIVVADAGCQYDTTWFEQITAPFQAGEQCVATAFGSHVTKETSFVQRLIAAATTPAPQEFTNDWLPSSRSVAFTKEVWRSVGGYPEWLPICEDIVFDLDILASASFAYVREPLVFWSPRPTLGAYVAQLYKYTRGDGHANLFLHRQLIRYAVYLFLIVSLVGSVAEPMILLLPFLGGALYMRKFFVRWKQVSKEQSIILRCAGVIFLPFVILVGDIAKMAGYPVGVFQRLSGAVRPSHKVSKSDRE